MLSLVQMQQMDRYRQEMQARASAPRTTNGVPYTGPRFSPLDEFWKPPTGYYVDGTFFANGETVPDGRQVVDGRLEAATTRDLLSQKFPAVWKPGTKPHASQFATYSEYEHVYNEWAARQPVPRPSGG